MTGISLGVKTLLDGMTSNKQLVEAALILGGASPLVAIEYQIAVMLGIVGSGLDRTSFCAIGL